MIQLFVWHCTYPFDFFTQLANALFNKLYYLIVEFSILIIPSGPYLLAFSLKSYLISFIMEVEGFITIVTLKTHKSIAMVLDSPFIFVKPTSNFLDVFSFLFFNYPKESVKILIPRLWEIIKFPLFKFQNKSNQLRSKEHNLSSYLLGCSTGDDIVFFILLIILR